MARKTGGWMEKRAVVFGGSLVTGVWCQEPKNKNSVTSSPPIPLFLLFLRDNCFYIHHVVSRQNMRFAYEASQLKDHQQARAQCPSGHPSPML